jgi:glycosyltransferase involved in cell wall biosynthesis
MEVLLINYCLYTGGVETLMVRMANWLVRKGHGCSILLRDTFDGDLRPLLDERVRVRTLANRWDLLAMPVVGSLLWKSWKLPRPDMIYTMEQSWSVVSLLVRDLFVNHPPKVATGAYHPRQFTYEYVPRKWGRLGLFRQKVYNLAYTDEQKFFMSEEVRAGHEEFFNRPMPDGWVWPLPIEIPPDELLSQRKPVPRRILSIGRLTRFKTYSWYMVPILYALREKYPDVQWHIHGFGAQEKELVEDVWKDAIRDGLIVFHGPIRYEDISTAFHQASVFIGMGTTLLEAAAWGVPAIPALTYDEDALSWGYIDQMPYYTCGELIPGRQPTAKVMDLICRLFGMNAKETEQLAAKGREYVNAYSMDHLMERFLEKVNELPSGEPLSASDRLRYLWIRALKFPRNLWLSLSRIGREPLRHAGGYRVMH